MRSFNGKWYIALFLLICLIPSLGMLICPSEAAANEILSPTPSWGAEMLTELREYVNDHFAFRQELVTLWAKINAVCFQTSAEPKVVLGQDDWLFYAEDFESSLTEEDMEQIAVNLEILQRQIESQGSTFLFTIAPDKSTLYADQLPKLREKISWGKELEPYLRKHNINYVNLLDQNIPYFKTDSHWTSFGAAMVCDRLLGTDYAGRVFSKAQEHTGDLYEMLYPAGNFREEDPTCELSFEVEGSDGNGNAITIRTRGQGEKTLYCWRDSFGVSLYPYLADATKEAVFSRKNKYDASDAGNADLVILEIVERNLGYLLEMDAAESA